ncbi:hypothetical protein, partial [Candidatus Liberibacter asiaticus]|uniref:hypothetical protein n=1 Tax=Liberibacter asiaticus TaxID=34021 RepID=UPI001AEE8726
KSSVISLLLISSMIFVFSQRHTTTSISEQLYTLFGYANQLGADGGTRTRTLNLKKQIFLPLQFSLPLLFAQCLWSGLSLHHNI